MNKLTRRTLWRLYAVAVAATVTGVACNATLYHDSDTGDTGVYYAPVGVEYTADGPLAARVAVWSCGEGRWPSWRCPVDAVTGSIAVGRPGTLHYGPEARTDRWEPLPAAMARQVRRVSSADQRWCWYRWPAEDSLSIVCRVDGTLLRIESKEEGS